MGNEARVERQDELRVAREQWKESGAIDPHQHIQLLMVITLICYKKHVMYMCRPTWLQSCF